MPERTYVFQNSPLAYFWTVLSQQLGILVVIIRNLKSRDSRYLGSFQVKVDWLFLLRVIGLGESFEILFLLWLSCSLVDSISSRWFSVRWHLGLISAALSSSRYMYVEGARVPFPNNARANDTGKLERLQERGLRTVYKEKHDSYSQLLERSKLPTSTNRRL